ETERRRAKQIAFNQANNITPAGIKKEIRELIDGVYHPQAERGELQVAQGSARYDAMDEKQLAKEVTRLEKLMVEHANNLEFEKATQIRHQLHTLKEQLCSARGADNIATITEKSPAPKKYHTPAP